MEDLVKLVYAHIGEASMGNVLKIRDKFSFKEGEEGFSPEEFCDKFVDYCLTTLNEENTWLNSKLVTTTMEFKRSLKSNGRKDSMFDIYLLNLRKVYKEMHV